VGAVCHDSKFAGANLTYADLSHADLTRADMTRTKLFRAVLHKIREEDARWDQSNKAAALKTNDDLAEAEDWVPAPDKVKIDK
jgi:uncharacterized protein YjbI with pentapeptide repeats